uniref:SXP/RAL-2 family protein Ani s 5-like cation-binding domain-containing protein n=1 Tax=Syphacia muris TaxID=451379 RepID=A0A0N5APG1_9BILA
MSHHLFYTAAILLILVVVCYSSSEQKDKQTNKPDKSARDANKFHQRNGTNSILKKPFGLRNGEGRRNSTQLPLSKAATVKRTVPDRMNKLNDNSKKFGNFTGKLGKGMEKNMTAAVEKLKKGLQKRKANFQKQNATMAKGNFKNQNTANLQQLRNKLKESVLTRNAKTNSTLKQSDASKAKRNIW